MLALERPTVLAPARVARRDRGRVPDAIAARRAVRRLARRARSPLVDQPRRETARARRLETSVAERAPTRSRPSRSSRRQLAGGSSPRDSLGAYWELWRGYDPFGVAKWIVYHLADIEIYLAVIPLAVAPIVLTQLIRRGRAGAAVDSAFASLFLAANATGLLVVAGLHEHAVGLRPPARPLRVLPPPALADRLRRLARGRASAPSRRGRDRSRARARPARGSPVPPARERGRHRHRAGRALGLGRGADSRSWPALGLTSPGGVRRSRSCSPRSCCPGARQELWPSRFSPCSSPRARSPGSVMIDAPEDAVFAGGLDRSWIDDARARGRSRHEALHRQRLRSRRSPATRSFSRSSSTRPSIAPRTSATRHRTASRSSRVDVGAGGALLLATGRTVRSPTTSSPSRASSSPGEKVATGTNAELVLWRTDGPVRVVGRLVERRGRASAPAPSARAASSHSD